MGSDRNIQSRMAVEEKTSLESGHSRINTACHAQVKFNDADYIQMFNAEMKTLDTKVTQEVN